VPLTRKKIRTLNEKDAILRKTNRKCRYCGLRLTVETMTKDHMLPSSRGGKDGYNNVVACCFPCNQLKGARTTGEFKIFALRYFDSWHYPARPYEIWANLFRHFQQYGRLFWFELMEQRPGPKRKTKTHANYWRWFVARNDAP
jgi:hypothetical protein